MREREREKGKKDIVQRERKTFPKTSFFQLCFHCLFEKFWIIFFSLKKIEKQKIYKKNEGGIRDFGLSPSSKRDLCDIWLLFWHHFCCCFLFVYFFFETNKHWNIVFFCWSKHLYRKHELFFVLFMFVLVILFFCLFNHSHEHSCSKMIRAILH